MSDQDTFVGVDVGTSGAKAVVIDRAGQVLRSASAQYRLSTPRPGWTEQNPSDWWDGVGECLDGVGWDAGEGVDHIGVTGQMHGAVCLDAAGEVIRPAILWNDQRTADACAAIERMVGPRRVRTLTGSPPLTGLQLPKLLWLREHEPAHYERVRSVLCPKDYVRSRLTGEHATEPSDASGTGAFDIGRGTWSHELLGLVNVDAGLFPPVESSVAVRGAGDQAAAAVGTGAVRQGIVSVCLGTSGVVFAPLDALPSRRKDAVQLACDATGRWHAMTVMLSCGGAFRWLRDVVGGAMSYEQLTDIAGGVASGCEGLMFLPYLSGERSPHNDPTARGAFVGLTLRHGRRHLARAVLEGVTFGLRDGLAALIELTGITPTEIRLTGGGARSAVWRQVVADVFGVPCVTVACDEGPAYGAALLAGVAAGWWTSVAEACDEAVALGVRTEPSGADYRDAYARYRALYPALRPFAMERA